MSRLSAPKDMAGALRMLAAAQEGGSRVRCQRCSKPAVFALGCETGEFQGVACEECWRAHEDFMKSAMVFLASGLVGAPLCSRCGSGSPGADHVIVERFGQ